MDREALAAALPMDTRRLYTFADPLLEGLHARLPAKGESFTEDQKANWIELAEKIFAVMWGPE